MLSAGYDKTPKLCVMLCLGTMKVQIILYWQTISPTSQDPIAPWYATGHPHPEVGEGHVFWHFQGGVHCIRSFAFNNQL